MTHAYNEEYLNDAMRNLGEAVDYAVNECHMDMATFFEMFIACGLASQFSSGVPKVISGTSGTELVWDIYHKSGITIELPPAQVEYDYSLEYWCGWILAYYQWYTGRTFKEILQLVTCEEIAKLYPTLHEASENKFVDTVNSIIRRKKPSTKLQTLRRICGYSQRQLALKSGVNLRTLQQYELRAKDINKAAGSTLMALSKVLGCRMENLLEYDFGQIDEEAD